MAEDKAGKQGETQKLLIDGDVNDKLVGVSTVKPDEEPSRAEITVAIAAFAFCSSCLLVVNKLAVHHLPSTGFILFMQLLSATLVVQTLSNFGVIKRDALEWSKVRAFLPVATAFALTIFTSVKALEYANVETFIIIRCMTPIPVSIFEYLYLGRELPNAQSILSMLFTIAGAVGYVATDSHFVIHGYIWVFAWLAIFVFDQVYIKHVVESVDMTTWGRVFYSNLLSLLPIVLLGLAFDKRNQAMFKITKLGCFYLLFSCAIGTGMSFASYQLRKMVSAASFTMVGTMCKILTVAINVAIWDKHASTMGLLCLSTSLAAGSLYQQAPKRKAASEAPQCAPAAPRNGEKSVKAAPECNPCAGAGGSSHHAETGHLERLLYMLKVW